MEKQSLFCLDTLDDRSISTYLALFRQPDPDRQPLVYSLFLSLRRTGSGPKKTRSRIPINPLRSRGAFWLRVGGRGFKGGGPEDFKTLSFKGICVSLSGFRASGRSSLSRSASSTSCRNVPVRSRWGRKSGDALLDAVRFTETSPAAALSRRLSRDFCALSLPAGDVLLDLVRPITPLSCMSLVLRASIFLHIRSAHSVLPHIAIWGLIGS